MSSNLIQRSQTTEISAGSLFLLLGLLLDGGESTPLLGHTLAPPLPGSLVLDTAGFGLLGKKLLTGLFGLGL